MRKHEYIEMVLTCVENRGRAMHDSTADDLIGAED